MMSSFSNVMLKTFKSFDHVDFENIRTYGIFEWSCNPINIVGYVVRMILRRLMFITALWMEMVTSTGEWCSP